MKYEIHYYSIQDNHILATPRYTHTEFVEVNSKEELDKYICSKADLWSNRFIKNKYFNTNDISKEYNYISSQGGVKINLYKKPEFRKPKFKKL